VGELTVVGVDPETIATVGRAREAWHAHLEIMKQVHFNLTESMYRDVLQQSISAKICQLIPYYYKYKRAAETTVARAREACLAHLEVMKQVHFYLTLCIY